MDVYILLAYISLIIYILLGIYMFKVNTKHYIYIFLLYFYQFTAIVSSLYIEHGVFITEQARYSYPTGATARLVLYNLAFFLPLSFFLRKIFDKELRTNKLIKRDKINNIIGVVMISAISVSVILLFYNLLKTGIPLFSDGQITRYIFWEKFSKYEWAQKIHYQVSLMGFILGLIHATSKGKRVRLASVFLLILIISYLILFGEKFSSIFRTLYMYLIPFYTIKFINKKKYFEKRDVLLILTIFVMLIGLTVFHYSQKEGSALELMIYRALGLQGHTWWGADEYLLTNKTFDYAQHLSDEWKGIIDPTQNRFNTGMRFLMILIGEPRLVDIYISNNVNFTMAYPAITIFTFGYVGAVIFQILFALVFSFIISLFYNSIAKKQYFISILATKLYISGFTLFYQGDYFEFFNLQVLFIFYLVGLSWLLMNFNRRRSNSISFYNRRYEINVSMKEI
ncbi:hypothetical protein TGS27_2334 [Geobacillus stearothermophilus]|uniref:DUF6418 domain-containing protein n=1 Tax=Geobacillus stearothermophilus TaxID=1422 RepID=UPI0007D9808C|nr:DUF6418 domain-containing protein [Geobacillus stearothermophilus]OAO78695.1 hypothetical protein TGS27_2334 [Geobacillus stearothermophilus]